MSIVTEVRLVDKPVIVVESGYVSSTSIELKAQLVVSEELTYELSTV